MVLDIIPLVIWLIAGILTLCHKSPVSKFEYALVWTILILNLIANIGA